MLAPAVSKLGRKYGLKPHRADHGFAASAKRVLVGDTHAPAPSGFTCDYEPFLRPVRDQGNEGSCGPHAWNAEKEFNCVIWALLQMGWKPGEPMPADLPKLNDWLSVAHLYWNILLAQGQWPNDEGTDNATAGGILQNIGVCPERFLPYVPGAMTPGNAQCDTAGTPYRMKGAALVPIDEQSFDAVLAAYHCIVLGFYVHPSFEDTGSDGIVPPLRPGEGLLGGHDTLVCGKRADGLYKVRNSWSSAWGDHGYFWVSAAYLASVGMDAWTSTAQVA